MESDLIQLRCRYHPEQPATAQCEHCGDYLCEECAIVAPSGRSYCAECLRRRIGSTRTSPGDLVYLAIVLAVGLLAFCDMALSGTLPMAYTFGASVVLGLAGLVWGLLSGGRFPAFVGVSLLVLCTGMVGGRLWLGWTGVEADTMVVLTAGAFLIVVGAATAVCIYFARHTE